ncbi:MAG TPA: hypothetical protein VJ825_01295 [Gemmatimonadaceae bacterium]|nr:hypothetical protein [Gemmatimonadaceae bacterium]
MHNIRAVRLWSAIAAVSAAALVVGCNDNPLSVQNTDNPDVPRVYSTPAGVEAIVGKLFQQMWNAQQGNIGLGVQSQVMSFESHSGLANFGMGARASIPRQPVSNTVGNSDQAIIYNDFDELTRNARSAANAVAALKAFVAAGNSTGSPARDARAISFGYFNLGYGLANVALLYDSAAIITPLVPSDVVPPLSPAADVMAVALEMLDSAIAVAESPEATTGTNGWPIPTTWVSGDEIPIDRWEQIIHSYKARFRAGVARTPAERAAIDWNAVVADATAGITEDFIVNADNAGGWNATWLNQLAVDATWSQMTPFILGMADTTGAYDSWLATPVDSRSAFLLRTPDKRFPSGETRAEQNAASGAPAKTGTPAGSNLYFYNRLQGDDKPAAPWGTWYYDNQRFWGIRFNGGNGPVEALTLAENNMLAAEGYMRTGRTAQAVPLINLTRTAAGLPAIPSTTDQNTIVPGGSACVPRVPQPPSFTSTACGTVWEAMKWEKRIETSFTGYAQWFIDARGWGDLTEGTILEWPVPWEELYARQNLALYTTDKVRAAKGTYGF